MAGANDSMSQTLKWEIAHRSRHCTRWSVICWFVPKARNGAVKASCVVSTGTLFARSSAAPLRSSVATTP